MFETCTVSCLPGPCPVTIATMKSFEEILSALESPDEGARVQAVIDLVRSDDKRAGQYLQQTTDSDESPRVRAVAAKGLTGKKLVQKLMSRQEGLSPGTGLEGSVEALASYQDSEYGADTVVPGPDTLPPDEPLTSGGSPHPGGDGNPPRSHYVVTDEVGSGGMGVILNAFDTEIQREVAMKVIASQWQSSREYIERFVREAQVQGQLEHPNICPVHELGVDENGQVFFTMKKVHGMSLAELIWWARECRDKRDSRESKDSTGPKSPKGPPSTENADSPGRPESLTEILSIFLKICDGIAFAHSRGIIHRDLKPDNIMTGDFGEVYVMDWGLARILGSQDDERRYGLVIDDEPGSGGEMKTMSGSVVGTPSYMSPEQAKGLVGLMDERSDIYSLGALLYELLTLEPPFSGPPWDVLSKIGKVLPQPPSSCAFGRDLPPELDSIIMKCLTVKKQDRYQSVRALKREIELFLSGRPIGAMEYSLWRVFTKWMSRNRVLASSVIAVLAILIFSFGVSFVRISASEREALKQRDRAEEQRLIAEEQRLEAEDQRSIAEEQRTRADEQRSIAEKQRLEAVASDIKSRFNLGMMYEEKRDIEKVLEIYDEVRQDMEIRRMNLFPFIDLFRWRARYNEGRPIQSSLLLSNKWGLAFRRLCYSPDGRLLAVSSWDGFVRLINTETGEEAGRFMVPGVITVSLAFSPDGTLIATGGNDGTLRLWTISDKEEKAVKKENVVTTKSAVLSDPALQDALAHMDDVRGLVFTMDGKHLISSGDEVIKFWSVSRKELDRSLWGHLRDVFSVAVSPDGRYLVSGGREKDVRLWDMESGQMKSILYDHWGTVEELRFSPDGTMLASACNDTTVKIWDMEGSRLITTLRGHRAEVQTLDFSPNSRVLVTGGRDGTVRFWDVERQADIGVLRGHNGVVYSARFHPTDETVATAGSDRIVKLWSMDREPLVHTMELGDVKVSTTVFSPDGKRLAVGTFASRIVPVLLFDTTSWARASDMMSHGGRVRSIAFSRDGALLASVGDDGLLKLADLKTDSHLVTIDVRTGEQTDFIASLMDAAKDLWTFKPGDKWKDVGAVDFSPDGTLLATGSSDGTVKLWDVASRQCVHAFEDLSDEILGLAFNPDGSLLAACGDDKVLIIWNVKDRSQVAAYREHAEYIHALAFSPDGTAMVSSDGEGKIFLRDLATNRVVRKFSGHIGRVNALSFSPDGRLLASGGNDSSIKLWDVRTGECLITLQEHAADVESVDFNADGTLLSSGGRDGAVRIWKFGQALKPLEF